MRKWSLIFGLLACSRAYASQDIASSMRPALWRTSYTCNAENFVLIATGTIHLHSIVVGSPTVMTDSYVALFNSSAPAAATLNLNVTTASFLATVANDELKGAMAQPVVYDMLFSTGVVVNKTGISCINIQWDFVLPQNKSPFLNWAP